MEAETTSPASATKQVSCLASCPIQKITSFPDNILNTTVANYMVSDFTSSHKE